MLSHDKDYLSFCENCYYIGGSDDGVLSTPDGKVGKQPEGESCFSESPMSGVR
jgi:hypothetical protein